MGFHMGFLLDFARGIKRFARWMHFTARWMIYIELSTVAGRVLWSFEGFS
jgi:hypothetical protein